MYRQIVKVNTEVIKEILPPQFLYECLEFWYIHRFLKSHHKIYATLSRYGGNDSNGFIGILLIVDLNALILLTIFMGGDGRFGYHHFINVDNVESVIIGTL